MDKLEHMLKFFVSMIVCMAASLPSYAQARKDVSIEVRTQSDFDRLGSALNSRIGTCSSITVKFSDGRFYFNDSNKITISGNDNCDIKFVGKAETILISDGEDYSLADKVGDYSDLWYKVRLKGKLDKFATYLDSGLQALYLCDTGHLNDAWQTNISNAAITVTKSGDGCIKLPDELKELSGKDEAFFRNSWLVYKAQWSDAARDIRYSNGKNIYFSLDEWLLSHSSEYVTSFYRWSTGRGIEPYQPFFIVNTPLALTEGKLLYDDDYLYIPGNVRSLHVCRFGRMMEVRNSKAKVSFESVQFVGTRLGDFIEHSDKGLWDSGSGIISFKNSGTLTFKDCTIRATGGALAGPVYESGFVEISDCTFEGNHTDCIIENWGKTEHISFTDNRIHNFKQALTGRPALYMAGDVSRLTVTDNDVSDVTRCFVYYGEGTDARVERNKLHCTEGFRRYPARDASSDTGVLVYSHLSGKLLVQDNLVFDLPANLNFSGVMVDNGTGNATISGNTMFNVGDHTVYCWKDGGVTPVSLNNRLISNVLIGNVRFGGYRKGWPGNASYSGNVFSADKGLEVIRDSHATDNGGNRFLTSKEFRIEGDKLFLPRAVLKKSSGARSFPSNILTDE